MRKADDYCCDCRIKGLYNSHLSVTGIAPGWASGVEDHFVAQAKYDFTGQGNDELTFKAGQNIHVAPKGKLKSD